MRIIVFTLVLFLTSGFVAADTISACLDANNGTLYNVRIGETPTKPCKTADEVLQWSIAGPAGPQGPQGSTGPTGPQGANGPQGDPPLILKSTSTFYTGVLGGRTGATEKCRLEYPGSHFPTVQELDLAHATRGIVWNVSETTFSWIDDQVDGGCGRWVTDNPVVIGDTIQQTGTWTGRHRDCDNAYPLTCAVLPE